MRLVLDERALADFENIYRWIARERPKTAISVQNILLSAFEQLTLFPKMGRIGRIAGTREWVVPKLSYTIVYRIDEAHDTLRVIAIFHQARSR